MENCLVSGSAGISSERMGCFDTGSTGQMAPRSTHEGCVNVSIMDGAVRFINNSIDTNFASNTCGQNRGVWQSLHTRAGNEEVSNF
ncbi:MAG: hypothetical protein CMJ78_12365 [Planctomycetaceae bacterium]|nr:hypothetical protein [Planctomycetaceae bacterium]